MNKFARKSLLLMVAVASAFALVSSAFRAHAATEVTWFIGLGTGAQKDQLAIEQKVADKFNASQSDIHLNLNIASSNAAANGLLSALIGAGKSPDIVGPVGYAGSNSFPGQWLDLQALVTSNKYDTSAFPDALVKLYQTPKGLLGLPFAVYPSLLFYNKDLFDEAKLAYPPTKVGEKYNLNGKDVDWDWATVGEVAKLLTVDSSGEDATSAKFDPKNIVQYGFNEQWGTIRADLSTFGGQPVIDPTTGKVKIGDNWRAGAQWMWDGIWKYHFIPTATAEASKLLQPSAFSSGKIAMSRVPLWYTCCMDTLKSNWDLGIEPSYKGVTASPTDADTFRISKDSKVPDAAFKVLSYLLGDAAGDLLTTYGAFPARSSLIDAAIKLKADKFPSVKNWSIVAPSLALAAVPHHESDYPNFVKGQNRFQDFRTLLYGDTGASIDVSKELDKLQADVQAIVDAPAAGLPPTNMPDTPVPATMAATP